MIIGILTLHSNTNFGGGLQQIALFESLKALGHEPRFLCVQNNVTESVARRLLGIISSYSLRQLFDAIHEAFRRITVKTNPKRQIVFYTIKPMSLTTHVSTTLPNSALTSFRVMSLLATRLFLAVTRCGLMYIRLSYLISAMVCRSSEVQRLHMPPVLSTGVCQFSTGVKSGLCYLTSMPFQ